MTAIPLPVETTAPEHIHEGAGRLQNCRAIQLRDGAGTKITRRRVAGMTQFATSSNTGFRGAKQVGSDLYSAWVSGSGKVYKSSSAGGAMTALTGNLPGSARAFFAANNASTPDVVAVVPGEGAFVVSTTAVSAYPDADVSTPNSVCFHKGYFFFSYGDAKMRSSGINSTSINTNDVATAEYKRDTLYRVISYNGQLEAFGSESTEFWGGQNDTGFPLSFITADDVGIVGPYAVTGEQDGFNGGLHFVGSDFRVRRREGYKSVPVSTPDLERLIAAVTDKTTIMADSYIENGMPIVEISSPTWTWELNLSTGWWNERASYQLAKWRGMAPFKAYDKWMAGDSKSGNIYVIDPTNHKEAADPLRMRIETGPMGNFPNPVQVDRVELYVTLGVGIAAGHDPDQTDPSCEISVSRDGGYSWPVPRIVKLGRQSVMTGRVAANSFGHCIPQGARLRIDIADAVPVGVMGGDLISTVLQ